MKNDQVVPADIAAANAARDVLVKFNAKTADRSALSTKDEDALRTLEGHIATMLETAPLKSGHARPEAADATASIVGRYLAMVRGQVTLTVAGMPVDTPAIESASVRLAVEREGARAAKALAEYVSDRWAREEKSLQVEAARRERFAFLMSNAPASALIRARAEVTKAYPSLGSIGLALIQAISVIQQDLGNHGAPGTTLTTEDVDRFFAEEQGA